MGFLDLDPYPDLSIDKQKMLEKFDDLSFKTDVNVPSKIIAEKLWKQDFLFRHRRKRQDPDPNPDPYQNVTDP
jgi:hypothetical protein